MIIISIAKVYFFSHMDKLSLLRVVKDFEIDIYPLLAFYNRSHITRYSGENGLNFRL